MKESEAAWLHLATKTAELVRQLELGPDLEREREIRVSAHVLALGASMLDDSADPALPFDIAGRLALVAVALITRGGMDGQAHKIQAAQDLFDLARAAAKEALDLSNDNDIPF